MSLSGDIISNMNMEAEISAIGEISGEVDLSGAGTTPHIVASATVSPDPGIPSCNVVRSGTDETPNFTFNFEGIKGEPGEQGEQGVAGVDGTDGITPSVSATASVSPATGTPSVVVTRSGTDAAPNFDFAFAGLKGERGAKGDTGEAGPVGPTGADGVTPDISATASVSNTTGTPSVVVTKTGADMNPNFDFAFENIKGEQGIQGDPGRNGADGVDGVTPIISATGSADNATGIPNVVITRSGTDTAPNFDFAFHNIKGEKGDTGEGVPDDIGADIGSVVTHTSTGNEWVIPSADNTSYDNTQSGLTASDVQDAIDENAAAISLLNFSLMKCQQVQFNIPSVNIPAGVGQYSNVLTRFNLKTSTIVDTVFTNKQLKDIFGGHSIIGCNIIYTQGPTLPKECIVWTNDQTISASVMNISSSASTVTTIRLLVFYI